MIWQRSLECIEVNVSRVRIEIPGLNTTINPGADNEGRIAQS